MSTDTNYIGEQAFYDYIKSPRATNDANVQAAIAAASRSVDSFCARRFYTAWETQYFRVDFRREGYLWVLDLGDMDIANFDDEPDPGSGVFQVACEQGNDGTYPDILVAGTDFIGEPINQSSAGITGWPYTHLRAINGRVWPIDFTPWQRPTVRIKANFGWTEIPTPVVQATAILTALYAKLGDAALGWAGIGTETGPVRVRDVPQAASLLQPYRKGNSYGMA